MLAFRRRLLAATILTTLSITTPVLAQSAGPSAVVLDIPAGPLGGALQALAAQTHLQLLFSSGSVAGRRAPALHGRYTLEQALERLLGDSDMQIEHTSPTVIVLKPRRAMQTRMERAADPLDDASQITDPATSSAQSSAPDAQTTPTAALPTPEIVVTGTHIRGVQVLASPTVEITADDLRRNGDATVADALDRLPQNFAGEATPITSILGSDRAETNAALAQGVNLRGLGASSTLVLINGRRLAGSGLLGDFSDVSAIPTAAVDHVEVLLDGASAIYGSDAVGGVVNIITKQSFTGAETSIRFAQDAGNVGGAVQVGQTFGVGWDGGHLLLAYEYQHDDAIPASARPFTADADLRSLGGTNHDVIYGSPGNVLGLNGDGTAFVAAYAIPGGGGVGITPADFQAGQANLFNFNAGTDITPNQDRNGLFFDLTQAFDPKTSLDIQGRYNLRVFNVAVPAPETILSISNANPYFVSLHGETSDDIGYSTAGAAGGARTSGTDKSFDLSIGLTRDLSKTWRIQAYAGYTEDLGRTFYSHSLNSDHLDEALGNLPDNPATAFSTAKNGFFNPYGSGRSNSQVVTDFVTDGYSGYINNSQIGTFNLQADGVVVPLPGGDLKAAVGAQYRHERFEPTFFAVDSDTPFLQGGQGLGRDVTAAFGELNIPLVGKANALPGVQRLEVSLAGRVEHYDDVGTTANPKIGVLWKPIADLALHATYGTSFRAPALPEVSTPTTVTPAVLPEGSGQAVTLLELGGNPTLKPQTARTLTAGFDYNPAWVHGLHVGATWFSIDFSNQIAQPGVANTATVLTDPAFASLVTRIDNTSAADEAKVAALLAKADSGLSGIFPISAYTAIVDGRYVNTTSLDVAGVDLNLDYRFTLYGERFSVTGSGSYLYDYSEQQTPASSTQQLVTTAGYPVDFRGRATGDWSHGPYVVTASVNYVNSYKDPIADRTVSAWTTLDLSASWTAPMAQGPLRGFVVTAAVQNLFDTDPPFYDSFLGFGYDAANANPLGRVLSLQLQKRW